MLISGCVTQPKQINGSTTARDAKSVANRPAKGVVSQAMPGSQPAAKWGRDEHKSGASTPAAEPDLWSQIRSGFQLDSNASRPRVREWTQAYATHSADLEQALARARPFLWHVVQQVGERDMPTEIALLPIVESGYDPSARSYMGASGLWQFMPGTATHMGLSRDWWYDERNDVIASTHAALDYLSLLAQRYDGDWLLALAAYNAGPGRVDAALARARSEGSDDSYWSLELPAETTQYVPKLLAIRRVMKTPAQFGMDWPTLDNVARTRAVALPSQTELAVAARMLDMPEDDLRRLNPGLRRWASAPDADLALLVPAAKAAAFKRKLASVDPDKLVTRSTHTVRRGDVLSRIAVHYGVSVAALRQVNHLASDRIRIGQTLQIPRSGMPGQPAPPSKPTRTYSVQAGDTLWDIAHRYRMDIKTLRASNSGVAATLQPGQTLIIPGSATPPEPSTHVVQNGDSLSSIASKNDVDVADLRRWNRLGNNTVLQPGRVLAIDGPAPLPDYYQVESGDSLWSIAQRFSMGVTTLRSLNELSASSTIRPGQRLRLQPAASS